MNPTTVKNRLGDMKTIAEQLNIKEFPLEIRHKNGSLIYFEDSDGCWYKREFDSNGNEIYGENSTGYWYKKEYESKRNLIIYFEDSDGFWVKREYDCNAYQTYLENSTGFWVKRERGPRGALFYYEDSNGLVINNRRATHSGKVVEVEGIKYKLVKV
jgi:hypothetical protein